MPRDYEESAQGEADAEMQAPEAADDAASEKAARKSSRKRLPLLLLAGAAVAVGAWQGYEWWTNGRFQIETDDAYVAADYAVMSAKVSGYVEQVLVADHAEVQPGQPLAKIEDGDYRNALQTADANIAAQEATLARIDRQVDAAQASVEQAIAQMAAAEAALAEATADFDRYSDLAASNVASKQKLDSARAARDTATAEVAEAKAGVTTAKVQVAVVEAQRAEAAAAMDALNAAHDQAARDLEATVIRAPFHGVVGNRSIAAGDYVNAGKRLMAVVPLDQIYVEANFKETQLEELKPGQPVRLEVDAYPDREVIGHVESFSPASGAVFSLLPPENATGNFTKVVQRVTVRVAVPREVAAEGWLRPGLSVIATADTRGDEAPIAAKAGSRSHTKLAER